MKIRTLTPEDFEEIYALWLSVKGMGLNSRDDSREGFERYLKRNPTTCFTAELDGRIVGSIMSGHDGRRGFIYHTAVLPEYRRQGIGSELVKAALSALAAEGITKAALVVFSENEQGNKFWESMGFTARNDLAYRNISLFSSERQDT